MLAALICLAQIAEGCCKVLGSQLRGLVDMCLKVLPGLCCLRCCCHSPDMPRGQACAATDACVAQDFMVLQGAGKPFRSPELC